MGNGMILDDVENDLTPGTPVIKEGTKTNPTDPGEFLLGDDEVEDDDDTEYSWGYDAPEDNEDEDDT